MKTVDDVLTDGIRIAGIAQSQQLPPSDGAAALPFGRKPGDSHWDEKRIGADVKESLDAGVELAAPSPATCLGEVRNLNLADGQIWFVSLDPTVEQPLFQRPAGL